MSNKVKHKTRLTQNKKAKHISNMRVLSRSPRGAKEDGN